MGRSDSAARNASIDRRRSGDLLYRFGCGERRGIAAGTASAGLTRLNPVTMPIGGQPATVVYSGLTAGFPGLCRVNVVAPGGVATADAVPVVTTVAGQTSATVTMAVHEGRNPNTLRQQPPRPWTA